MHIVKTQGNGTLNMADVHDDGNGKKLPSASGQTYEHMREGDLTVAPLWKKMKPEANPIERAYISVHSR